MKLTELPENESICGCWEQGFMRELGISKHYLSALRDKKQDTSVSSMTIKWDVPWPRQPSVAVVVQHGLLCQVEGSVGWKVVQGGGLCRVEGSAG